MKKIILIVAIVLVAVVGLTSFNGKSEMKKSKNTTLLASLIDPVKNAGGGKKQD
ncbi:hypothetical protein [Flavobacterium sp. BFFFF1]|uniref:hypothetical protein n=1 Tax=Flavobacterium sp. BFFFF1 TaxID=2015557 RepID=UPI0025C1F832|nr:hypothetical protein [Flavobacterium sp. BFFFF1]